MAQSKACNEAGFTVATRLALDSDANPAPAIRRNAAVDRLHELALARPNLGKALFAIPPWAPGFYLTRPALISNKTAQRQLLRPDPSARHAMSADAGATCMRLHVHRPLQARANLLKCGGPDQEVGAVLGRTQTVAGK